MFDIGPGDGFGIFTVISDHYGDSGIVSPHAVDQILKLVISQESLCSNGNEGTDVILCKDQTSVGEKYAPFQTFYPEFEEWCDTRSNTDGQ